MQIKNLKNIFSAQTTVLLLVFPSELDVDIHPWMNTTTKLCPPKNKSFPSPILIQIFHFFKIINHLIFFLFLEDAMV